MIYHPEMNQKPKNRIFGSQYNFRGTYSIDWKAADDVNARAMLVRLKIKPKEIRHEKQGSWSTANGRVSDVFHCLVTGNAHQKLMDADVTACAVLLD